jgi:hypothetical protein
VALETFLRENKAVLHRQDTTEAEQALKRGRMALAKSTDKSNLEDTSNYLKRFAAHLLDKMGGVQLS